MIILLSIFTLVLLLLTLIFVFYFERKIPAFIQDRMGPTEVGKFGILQPFADLLKLVQKEDIIPAVAEKNLFRIAPVLIFLAVFAGFITVPFTPNWIASGMETGVFFALAIVSLDVIGILAAGYASNSKFSVLGSMRAIAQIVSYEIPVGLCILAVVIVSQSLDLREIANQQSATSIVSLFGIKGMEITGGGILHWNIFRMPLLLVGFVMFYIATLAECNRAPFDIPEAESELIGGFHTEYSGFRFALFFVAEYGMMLFVSVLAVLLFLGGWNSPFPNIGSIKLFDWTMGDSSTISGNVWAFFWLYSKTLILLLSQVWMRWTFPRVRVDQLMYLCWKVLIPFSLGLVLICSLWKVWMI